MMQPNFWPLSMHWLNSSERSHPGAAVQDSGIRSKNSDSVTNRLFRLSFLFADRLVLSPAFWIWRVNPTLVVPWLQVFLGFMAKHCIVSFPAPLFKLSRYSFLEGFSIYWRKYSWILESPDSLSVINYIFCYIQNHYCISLKYFKNSTSHLLLKFSQ